MASELLMLNENNWKLTKTKLTYFYFLFTLYKKIRSRHLKPSVFNPTARDETQNVYSY